MNQQEKNRPIATIRAGRVAGVEMGRKLPQSTGQVEKGVTPVGEKKKPVVPQQNRSTIY